MDSAKLGDMGEDQEGGENQKAILRINEKSEFYAEKRQENLADFPNLFIFGANQIGNIDESRKTIADGADKEFWEESISQSFREMRKDLTRQARHSTKKVYVAELFTSSGYAAPLNPKGDIDINSIPDASLEMAVRNHIEQFKRLNEEFEQKLPEIKREVTENMDVAAMMGLIKIDPQILKQRLEVTKIKLVDGLKTASNDIYGYFDVRDEVVGISGQTPKEMLPKVVCHELLHAISGRSPIVKSDISVTYTGYEGNNLLPDLKNQLLEQRVGLRIDGEVRRFAWLNEAVTEELTIMLFPDTERLYEDGRSILRSFTRLGGKNLTLRMFFDAYFENYNPDNRADPVPKWKKLYAAFNQRFGSGALVALDEAIKIHGLETTGDLFAQSEGREIPPVPKRNYKRDDDNEEAA